ncbi:MAG: Plug domain-containing protein, partial [Gemmatimonas sp.]
GTRTLEVRAVGYYPERRAIDVVDGTAPVNVALVTFKSVLETVKISANYLRYSNLAGFRERQRTSVGQFITAADIARRQPITTSDLFRMVSGVYVDRDTEGDATILMRGVFEERCSPAVYIDGSYLSVLNASNLDSFVSPNEIAAIEVYSPTQVPAQFQPGLSGCGSIVIWTR